MLSGPSGARPRLVWTRIPVPLITGVRRDARRSCRLERMSATIASARLESSSSSEASSDAGALRRRRPALEGRCHQATAGFCRPTVSLEDVRSSCDGRVLIMAAIPRRALCAIAWKAESDTCLVVVTVFKIVAPTLCVGGWVRFPPSPPSASARLSRTPARAGWLLCCRRASAAARSLSQARSTWYRSPALSLLYTSAAVGVSWSVCPENSARVIATTSSPVRVTSGAPLPGAIVMLGCSIQCVPKLPDRRSVLGISR